MTSLAELAAALARDLPASSVWLDAGLTAGGVSACAVLAPNGELVVFHNVGGGAVPSRAAVVAILDALDAHVGALRAASPALDALAAKRGVACEVVAWSGPMELTLARRAGGRDAVEAWLTDVAR